MGRRESGCVSLRDCSPPDVLRDVPTSPVADLEFTDSGAVLSKRHEMEDDRVIWPTNANS